MYAFKEKPQLERNFGDMALTLMTTSTKSTVKTSAETGLSDPWNQYHYDDVKFPVLS